MSREINQGLDISNNKIIFPYGFGFLFLFGILLFFLLMGIFIFVCFFVKDTYSYNNLYALLVSIGGQGICIYELYILFVQVPAKFINNEFITKGKNPKYFPPFKKDCREFVGYKYTGMALEFTFTKGAKKQFHCAQFTKKQILKILQEIKNRGGFPDKEIKLDNYGFKVISKKKK